MPKMVVILLLSLCIFSFGFPAKVNAATDNSISFKFELDIPKGIDSGDVEIKFQVYEADKNLNETSTEPKIYTFNSIKNGGCGLRGSDKNGPCIDGRIPGLADNPTSGFKNFSSDYTTVIKLFSIKRLVNGQEVTEGKIDYVKSDHGKLDDNRDFIYYTSTVAPIGWITYKWETATQTIFDKPQIVISPNQIIKNNTPQNISVTIDMGEHKDPDYEVYVGLNENAPDYNDATFFDVSGAKIASFRIKCSNYLNTNDPQCKITGQQGDYYNDDAKFIDKNILTFTLKNVQNLLQGNYFVVAKGQKISYVSKGFNVSPEIIDDVLPLITPETIPTESTGNLEVTIELQKGGNGSYVIEFNPLQTPINITPVRPRLNCQSDQVCKTTFRLPSVGLAPNSDPGYLFTITDSNSIERGKVFLKVTGDIANRPGGPGSIKSSGDKATKNFCKDHPKDCTASGGSTCDPSKGGPGEGGVLTAIGCIPTKPTELIGGLLKVSTAAGGGVALLLMVFAAFQYMTSSGNPETLKKAQDQFTNAFIGLLFIIFSTLLLQIIGVDILSLPGFTP